MAAGAQGMRPSLLVRDLTDAAYRRLQARAKANGRSVQGEAALLLNSLLTPRPIAEFSDRFKMSRPPRRPELAKAAVSGRKIF